MKAKVITRQGTEVPVEARMLKNAGTDRWLIYDIAIENVSLIGNYRAQFDSIIRKESFTALLDRLKTKRDDFLDESGTPKARTWLMTFKRSFTLVFGLLECKSVEMESGRKPSSLVSPDEAPAT